MILLVAVVNFAVAPGCDAELSGQNNYPDSDSGSGFERTETTPQHRFGQMLAVDSPTDGQASIYAILHSEDGTTAVRGFAPGQNNRLELINESEFERRTQGTQWIALGDIDEDGIDELIGVDVEPTDAAYGLEVSAVAPKTQTIRIRYWNVPDLINRSTSRPGQLTRVAIPWGRSVCKIAVGRFRPDEEPGIAILLNSYRGELDTRNDIVVAFRDRKTPRFTTDRIFNERAFMQGSKDGPCLDFIVHRFKKHWGDRGLGPYHETVFEDMDGILTPSGHIVEVSEKDGKRISRELWSASLLTQAFEGSIDGLRMQYGALHGDDIFDMVLLAWTESDDPMNSHSEGKTILSIQREEEIEHGVDIAYAFNKEIKPIRPRALLSVDFSDNEDPSIVVGFANGEIKAYETSSFNSPSYHVSGILRDPSQIQEHREGIFHEEFLSDFALLHSEGESDLRIVVSGVERDGLSILSPKTTEATR